MMKRIAYLAFLALAACSYKAEVLDAPAYNVVSSYGNKIPGKWLLFVDAAPLDRPIKPSGLACSAQNFPISASHSFVSSAKQTIANLIEHVEIVPAGVSRDKLATYG